MQRHLKLIATEVEEIHRLFEAINQSEDFLFRHLLVLHLSVFRLRSLLKLFAFHKLFSFLSHHLPDLLHGILVEVFREVQIRCHEVMVADLVEESFRNSHELGEGALPVHVLHVVFD